MSQQFQLFNKGAQAVQTAMGLNPEWCVEAHRENFDLAFEPDRTLFFSELDTFFMSWVPSTPLVSGPAAICCSAIYGKPGFIQTNAAGNRMTIKGWVAPQDPLTREAGPTKVGAVGMMLHNRRRNRVNGTATFVHAKDADGTFTGGIEIDLRVDITFGNCPKYIALKRATTLHGEKPVLRSTGTAVDAEAAAVIARSDLSIIGTAYESDGAQGSHRGGRPGFIKVVNGGKTLLLPDYVGNEMYLTLGNIHLNGHVGFLIIDTASGDAVLTTGRATIVHNSAAVLGFALEGGTGRHISIDVASVAVISRYCPFTMEVQHQSPYSPHPKGVATSIAGGGGALAASIAPVAEEKEERPEEVAILRVTKETPDISTFWIARPKGPRAPAVIVPGQYAAFLVLGKTRTWTISGHDENTIRITVKRHSEGLASRHLHDATPAKLSFLHVGGDFVVPAIGSAQRPTAASPLIFIAGGVGITPMVSMLSGLVDGAAPNNNKVALPPLFLFYAVRTPADTAFAPLLQRWAEERRVTVVVHATRTAGVKFLAALPEALRSATGGAKLSEAVAFTCGPQGFDKDVAQILVAAGVRVGSVLAESFAY